MNEFDHKVVEAMFRFGGSFVKALSQAFLHADPINFQKLKDAFPVYWDDYERMVKRKEA